MHISSKSLALLRSSKAVSRLPVPPHLQSTSSVTDTAASALTRIHTGRPHRLFPKRSLGSSTTSSIALQLLFAHVHDAGHHRMHGAVVSEIACGREGVLVPVVRIQSFGGKALVVAGHGMR